MATYELYHGTDDATAAILAAGGISTTLGGGELGQGFYSGDLQHQAYNWAWFKAKKQRKVVALTIQESDFLALNPLDLDYRQALYYMSMIKYNSQTRTYLFNENAVWAPVVGRYIPNFNQVKFESTDSETYLNGSSVIRTIL